MSETPLDIITRHLDLAIESGDGAPDAATLATIISGELNQQFTMIVNRDIDAVEVRPTGFDQGWRKAGTGPEEVICTKEANPNWLRNMAVNALALAEHLEDGQGIRLPDNSRGRAFNATLGQFPTPPRPEGTEDITIRATGDPMLWYIGTDKKPQRLDTGFPPGSQGFPSGREAQIALALVDLSASRLHEVTK